MIVSKESQWPRCLLYLNSMDDYHLRCMCDYHCVTCSAGIISRENKRNNHPRFLMGDSTRTLNFRESLLNTALQTHQIAPETNTFSQMLFWTNNRETQWLQAWSYDLKSVCRPPGGILDLHMLLACISPYQVSVVRMFHLTHKPLTMTVDFFLPGSICRPTIGMPPPSVPTPTPDPKRFCF